MRLARIRELPGGTSASSVPVATSVWAWICDKRRALLKARIAALEAAGSPGPDLAKGTPPQGA